MWNAPMTESHSGPLERRLSQSGAHWGLVTGDAHESVKTAAVAGRLAGF